MIKEKTTPFERDHFPSSCTISGLLGGCVFYLEIFSNFLYISKMVSTVNISSIPNLNAIFRNTPKNITDFHLLQSSTLIKDLPPDFSSTIQVATILPFDQSQIFRSSLMTFSPFLTKSKVSESSTDSTCVRPIVSVPCHHYGQHLNGTNLLILI